MDKASEALLALKPVTFHYKEELDPAKMPQFGLVAEEVEKVNPDSVVHDDAGKVMTVRYEAVNAMLLNEFLKEHKAFIEEQHKVETLEATVADLIATTKEQAAQIQKVSGQLKASKPAPQVVKCDAKNGRGHGDHWKWPNSRNRDGRDKSRAGDARKLSQKTPIQMITLITVFAYGNERQTPKPKQRKRKEQP